MSDSAPNKATRSHELACNESSQGTEHSECSSNGPKIENQNQTYVVSFYATILAVYLKFETLTSLNSKEMRSSEIQSNLKACISGSNVQSSESVLRPSLPSDLVCVLFMSLI